MTIEIRVDALSVTHRGRLALEIDQASITPGTWALVGANGAGKTTLIQQIVGATRSANQHSGVSFHDADGNLLNLDHRTQVGYLPQEFGYYRHFTAYDFVRYFGLLRGVRGANLERGIVEALSRVDLSDRASHPLSTLSGGMIRRAGIAQALVHNPSLILLDEPTSGLDMIQSEQVMQVISNLGQDATVLFSTHNIDDLAQSDCGLIVLGSKSLQFIGRQGELKSNTVDSNLKLRIASLYS